MRLSLAASLAVLYSTCVGEMMCSDNFDCDFDEVCTSGVCTNGGANGTFPAGSQPGSPVTFAHCDANGVCTQGEELIDNPTFSLAQGRTPDICTYCSRYLDSLGGWVISGPNGVCILSLTSTAPWNNNAVTPIADRTTRNFVSTSFSVQPGKNLTIAWKARSGTSAPRLCGGSFAADTLRIHTDDSFGMKFSVGAAINNFKRFQWTIIPTDDSVTIYFRHLDNTQSKCGSFITDVHAYQSD